MVNTYRSARGAIIDMDRLRLANEREVAVGNARVNARGDLLDEAGNVVKTHDQVMEEFYSQPKPESARDMGPALSSWEEDRIQADNRTAEQASMQKMQEQIDALSKRLAEKESEDPNATIAADEAPLRGGLAAAIKKNQEAKKKAESNDGQGQE